MQEKGEVQKRLDQGLCPWCMQLLKEIDEPYTLQCTGCGGKITDKPLGEQDGDDT